MAAVTPPSEVVEEADEVEICGVICHCPEFRKPINLDDSVEDGDEGVTAHDAVPDPAIGGQRRETSQNAEDNVVAKRKISLKGKANVRGAQQPRSEKPLPAAVPDHDDEKPGAAPAAWGSYADRVFTPVSVVNRTAAPGRRAASKIVGTKQDVHLLHARHGAELQGAREGIRGEAQSGRNQEHCGGQGSGGFVCVLQWFFEVVLSPCFVLPCFLQKIRYS